MIHTGDISHLSKDEEFDDAEQLIKEAGLPVFYVPGEHDILDEGQGESYLDALRQGRAGRRLVLASITRACTTSPSSTS